MRATVDAAIPKTGGRYPAAGRCLVAVVAVWTIVASAALAGGEVIDAPRAHALATSGELVIVDVRTIEEWTQTGVPEGAREVALLPEWGVANPTFVDDVLAAVGNDKSTPVALICARGNRSAYAQGLLERNGFSTVYSISEGMIGSTHGPGWLNRGLPVETCKNC